MEPNTQEVQKTENIVQKSAPFYKRYRNIIIIAVIIIIILLGIVLYSSLNSRTENKTTQRNTSQTILPLASINFRPGDNLGAGIGQTQSVNIMIDTQGRPVDGAVIALLYDPKALSNVTISQVKDPQSAISSAFEKKEIFYDTKTGVVSLSLKIASTTPMQKGNGQVATLSFRRTTNKPTTVSFSPNTALLSHGTTISILKNNLTLQTLPVVAR
jgi:hypothetical protein